MQKIYIIGPLAALALFVAVFMNFKSGHRQREEARIAETARAKEAKLKAEVEARRAAIDEALKAQEERKQARAAREAAELAEKAARQLALDARDKVYREQEKLGRQLERLQKEAAGEKEVVARLESTRAALLSEQAFLREFVLKAESSVKKFEAVLVRIDSAERARAAAAETTKKKS